VVAPPQAFPHAPQFCGSEAREWQKPPQSWVPSGQVHEPWTQVVPWAQAWPHAPQFWGSVAVSTQAPAQPVVPGAVQVHLPPAQVSAAEQAVVQLPQWS
jgi:hypothetical protein